MPHAGWAWLLACTAASLAAHARLYPPITSTASSTSSSSASSSLSSTRAANISTITPAPNATATAPPASSGSAYASSCNAAKLRWAAHGGMSFVSASVFNTTTTFVYPSTAYTTITYLRSGAAPYTLCDGFPRIDESRALTHFTVPQTEIRTLQLTTSISTRVPQPNCTVGPSDCSTLQAAWKSAQSAYASWQLDPAATAPPPAHVPSPICSDATATPVSSAVGDALCAMQEASVQLLYWPVQTAKPCDACHRSLSDCPTTTLGPSTSDRPNIAVWKDQTLTSPTVYIAFEGLWTYAQGSATQTTPQTLIIPQSSTAVSTYCGQPGGGYGPPQPVNYNNFNRPVPADVYRCQPKCFDNAMPYPTRNYTTTFTNDYGSTQVVQTATIVSTISKADENLCSTIWDDYAPVLSIPEEFKTIRPAGYVDAFGRPSLCRFVFNEDAVLFDPPIALTQVQTAARPTLPNGNTAARPTPAEAHITPHGPTIPTAHQPTLPHPTPIAIAESQVKPHPVPTATPESQVKPHPAPTATPESQVTPSATISPPHQPPHQQTDANPPSGAPSSTTSPHIAAIIASVLGMTAPSTGQPGAKLTLALATDGAAIVVNGATVPLETSAPHATGSASVPSGTIDVGGTTLQWSRLGPAVVINGQALRPGARLSLQGQTLSLDGSSQIVVMSGGATTTLGLHATATDEVRPGGPMTGVSNPVHPATTDESFVIGGHTLTLGETVTLGDESSRTAGTAPHNPPPTRASTSRSPAPTASAAASLALPAPDHILLLAGTLLAATLSLGA